MSVELIRAGHAITLSRQLTMFSGHKIVSYGIMPILVVATPFRRRPLKFFAFFHVSEALIRFCCTVIYLSLYFQAIADYLQSNGYHEALDSFKKETFLLQYICLF